MCFCTFVLTLKIQYATKQKTNNIYVNEYKSIDALDDALNNDFDELTAFAEYERVEKRSLQN